MPSPSELLSSNNLNDTSKHHWDKSKNVAGLFLFSLLQTFKKLAKISKKLWKSKQGLQEKIFWYKVGATTTSKIQELIISVLKRDNKDFRRGNLKNNLTIWKILQVWNDSR